MAADLASLLPEWFQEIREFKELTGTENTALQELEDALKRVKDNHYILTCDSDTLAVHEKRLGLRRTGEESEELRRDKILRKYNTIVPFTEGFLRERLKDLFGGDYTMSIDAVSNILTIEITSDRHGALELLYGLLWDALPAHIKVVASQKVTKNMDESVHVASVVARACIQSI